jgi:hypothetical protein
MLHHGRFFKLDAEAAIGLGPCDCAPLNLVSGSVVYVEPPRRPELGRPISVFMSPFPPDCWGDLWHLEMSFQDRVGVMAALFELLRKLNVVPLAAESCTFASGEHHKAVVVCDCRAYKSDLDASHEVRIKRELAELQGLRAMVAAEFLEDLVFTNGFEPHLRLVRNAGHFRAFKRLRSRRREPQTATVADGYVRLPSAVIDHIQKETNTRLSDMNGAVVSDTSDRCLRLFVVGNQAGAMHLRVTLPPTAAGGSAVVFSAFLRRNFDILGSRLNTTAFEADGGNTRPHTQLELYLRPPVELAHYTDDQLSHVTKLAEIELSREMGEPIVLEFIRTKDNHGNYDSKGDPNKALKADLGSNRRTSNRSDRKKSGRRNAASLSSVTSE